MKLIRALPVALVLGAACSGQGSKPASLSAATVQGATLDDSTVVVRRIAVDTGIFFYPLGPPTQDGRYFTGMDETGNLVVRDLRTGERRRLTATAGWSDGYVENSRISPNGRTVAFRWTVIRPYSYELRTIGMDGSGERTLVNSSGDESEYADPADWSPDGRRLLAIMYRKDKSHQIALISATDGSVRVLKSMDWRVPQGLKFSPDGRWVVYDFQPDQNNAARDLFVLKVDGSRETKITSGGGPKVPVGWSPDGLGLYHSTKKDDATTVWYAPVREGRPAGAPKAVRSDIWGASVLGLSGAALYYRVSDAKRTVYSVAVDLEAGRALAAPVAVVAGSDVASTSAAIWSPDGNYVAFVRGDQPTGEEGHTIVIRSVSTEEERTIPVALERVYLDDWLSDGRAISIWATRRGQSGRYRVDLATGKEELIDQSASSLGILSPDGKTEFFMRRDSSRDSASVVARSVATHQERALFRGRGLNNLLVSPDGVNLAFFATTRRESDPKGTGTLVVIPATGGEPAVLLSPDPPRLMQELSWSSDSRHVLLRVFLLAGGEDELWMATPRTGETKKLLSARDMVRPRISPDGRRVVWVARTGGKTSELWVIENLPGSAKKSLGGAR